MIKSLIAKALKGDVRAFVAIMALFERLVRPQDQDGPETALPAEDMEILNAFLDRGRPT